MTVRAIEHEGEIIGHVSWQRVPLNEVFTSVMFVASTADGRRVVTTTYDNAVAWLMAEHAKAVEA